MNESEAIPIIRQAFAALNDEQKREMKAAPEGETFSSAYITLRKANVDGRWFGAMHALTEPALRDLMRAA